MKLFLVIGGIILIALGLGCAMIGANQLSNKHDEED